MTTKFNSTHEVTVTWPTFGAKASAVMVIDGAGYLSDANGYTLAEPNWRLVDGELTPVHPLPDDVTVETRELTAIKYLLARAADDGVVAAYLAGVREHDERGDVVLRDQSIRGLRDALGWGQKRWSEDDAIEAASRRRAR